MVDAVDDLKSSRSVQGYHFPNFEMLDAKISSALNKVIQNSYFKKKVSLEERKAHLQDRFFGRRQIAFMIYEYFRVTGATDTVLDYVELFSITVRNDDFQDFDTRWDGMLLSLSKIPTDDVLECLYKLRISESDQLETVLEFYELDINQKISTLDYPKLKTMVKRSRDQKIQSRNRRVKSGVERGRGECNQWKAAGQCSRGDTCSLRHDGNKSGKSTLKSAPSFEPQKDGDHFSRRKRPRGRSPSGRVKSKDVPRLPQRQVHETIV